MKTSQNTNQKKTFPKHMQEKLAITILVVTLALLALVGVLYRLIKTNQEEYNQLVLSQQHYDSRVIPYKRGDIKDRNGTILATSDKVYNLIIDPKQIMSDENDYMDVTTSALAECFGYDKAELTTMIKDNSGKAYVRYARQLTFDQKEAFDTLTEQTNEKNKDAGSTAKVKGVWFEDEYKRIYPYNSTACNVIGFARGDGMEGTGGIEQFYNTTLMGTNGREYGYLNDDSNLERVIKPATNGNTIVSTIDMNIQNIVEKYIDQWMQETGSKVTSVLVMDPNTAEVLAMSSSTKFDLNNPRDLSSLYTQEEQDAMDEAAKVEAWNTMWRNHLVSDTFEPGSPSKVFTVAAAMEEGLINGNETIVCNGFMEVGGWPIKCVKRTGHGPITITEGLMQSCNVVMMHLAQMTGKDRFYNYFQNFGFGAKTGVDLPGEASTTSLVYNAQTADAASLATNAFGQNYNCTMIQMGAAFSAAINGGSYYTPHVVKQILNEQGSVVKKVEPQLVREVMSDNTCNFLKQALYRTVAEGTGGAAKVPGYDVGGKTGTAEKYPRGQKKYVVSFMGFAPVDDPQVLIYVVIDEPNVPDQAHSTFASTICQKIMAEVLPYMNVFPTTDVPQQPDASGQLPEQEGISELPTGESPETQEGEGESEAATEASKVYETDEYVETIHPEEEVEGGDAEYPGAPPTKAADETIEEFNTTPE